MNCKTFWGVVLMLFLLGVGAALAQKESTKYEPTEIESLRLKVALQDAQLSEVAKNQAEADFQKKIQVFNDAQAKIRADHKWPETVSWNFGMGQFVDSKPATPPTPAPAAKP